MEACPGLGKRGKVQTQSSETIRALFKSRPKILVVVWVLLIFLWELLQFPEFYWGLALVEKKLP